MGYSLDLITAIAAYDCNIRDMLALYMLADKHNLSTVRLMDTLQDWTADWKEKYPRLFIVLNGRIAA